MLHVIGWIVVPLLAAGASVLLWQVVRARRELTRILLDPAAIAELFGREGRQMLEAAVNDPRIRTALADKTRLGMSTTILHRGIERQYTQQILAWGLPILALAAAAGVFLHPLAAALAAAFGAAGLAAPLHQSRRAAVRRDLGALALSLKIWYEYDPDICTDVIGVTGIFEPLLDYVTAHYVSAAKVNR